MKRQRGRGRKSSNPANRTFESNGPEVKIRGNASQIFDKYSQLARDAASSGDRVRAENLYQHAEHYFRILQANAPKRDVNAEEGEEADAQDNGEENRSEQQAREPREPREPRRRSRRSPRNEPADADPMNVVTPEGDAPAGDASEGGETPEAAETPSEDPAPRRRTRRTRRPRSDAATPETGEAGAALEQASTDQASADQAPAESTAEAGDGETEAA